LKEKKKKEGREKRIRMDRPASLACLPETGKGGGELKGVRHACPISDGGRGEKKRKTVGRESLPLRRLVPLEERGGKKKGKPNQARDFGIRRHVSPQKKKERKKNDKNNGHFST